MKKLSNYNILGFFLIMLVLVFDGCCKCDDPRDPECPNYDPCIDIEAPVASFGAGYKYDFQESQTYPGFFPDTTIYLDGDTIPGTCTFYSYNTDVDSFYWRVGDDQRIFRGKAFFLEFDESFHLQPITVELITLKKSNCFEEGFVRDTLRKNLVISSNPLQSPSIPYFNNKYYGISTEFPNDSFEIEYIDEYYQIKNFPKGMIGYTAVYKRDYDESYFYGANLDTLWIGHAKFQPEDRKKIIIKYKVSYDQGKTSNWYTYTGYRIE